jgi:hypothetical protein
MVTDQLPLPGPQKGFCECKLLEDGCGRYGTLKKPRRDGTRHVWGCKCRSCLGRRNRDIGRKGQSKARKTLGIQGATIGADHEENWRGAVRVEVKSGAQVRPAWTAYLKMENQGEAARAIGDNRPFIGDAEPPGTTDGLILIRRSQFWRVIQAVWEAAEHESSKQ